MPAQGNDPREAELDDFVRPFEAAQSGGEPVDLKAFLPEAGHPLYGPVLRELVCIDLEFNWAGGRRKHLEEYQGAFPDLFRDRESLSAIAFEDYRLRRQAGEEVNPADYERRFGLDVTGWPNISPGHSDSGSQTDVGSHESLPDTDDRLGSPALPQAAIAFLDRIRNQVGQAADLAAAQTRGVAGESQPAGAADAVHFRDPFVAAWLAQALATICPVGGEFLGFQLLAELGSGAFSRVYLSRQGELADRLVVVKIAPRLLGESRTLARLQHPNIVPVYSVHQTRDYQAVCMPFLGRTTFADILKDLHALPALPHSAGYLLDQVERRGREFAGASQSAVAAGPGSGAPAPSTALPSLSYVDGILWLAMLLADGLAHAHGQGIVHRDLKPANILLTDRGQPMLLDFNLSEDDKLHQSAAAARVGGTLPYMAPEQLSAFLDGKRHGDERSDICSLGIILYELLTARYVVENRDDSIQNLLRELIGGRGRPPSLRQWNPAVSPGAESIVHHCLELEPSRRYQSARALSDDLHLYLTHRPLTHAAEPSRWERVRKWRRRRPRLSSSLGAGSMAAVLVLALAAAFQLRVRHLAELQAKQQAEQLTARAAAAARALHEDLKSIEFLVGSGIPGAEVEQRSEWMTLVGRALDRHHVLESGNWDEGPLVAALAPEGREQLKTDMGELLLLATAAYARHGQLDFARQLSDLAAGCYPQESVPQAVWRQRAELARLAGQAGEGDRLARSFGETSKLSARDRYLVLITEFQRRGRLPEDLPLLIDASRQKKDNFAVWLILGNSYAGTGLLDEAIDCFDMAAALRPGSHWPILCRGLACLEKRSYKEARQSFDAVIQLKPELLEVYYDRALASYHLGDHVAARADLTRLIDDGYASVRAYFLRSRIRARQGDREGARADQEQGRRTEPRDERDWTARGLDRQPRDPIGALADYDTALKVNPRYLTALQNKANVLAEQLGRTDEAIAALDTLLGLYPGYVPARAGRGVLLARIGKREAAHADARMALEKDKTPFNTYQVAGIYALTSRQQPDDRREALRLLESALSQGFGLDLIDKDRDLDAIRDGPELRRLVEAARARRPASSPRTAQPKAGAQGWLPPADGHPRSPTVEHSLNTRAAATDRRLAE